MARGGIPGEALAGRQRLDKWIWFARLQRSRRNCADLIRAGHVRLNGRREASPGAFVTIGDVLTLALPGRTVVVRILALAERRQGDDVAKTLFYCLSADKQKVPAD